MQGKTVVVTGATSGIGAVAARALARQGARIVFVARDPARARRTLEEVRSAGPGREHAFHVADLSRLAGMKGVAAAIRESEPRIDVLINNAGALFPSRQVTEDGLEMTFATNHLAYFVVTNLLLDRLEGTPGARVVSTASGAHERAKLDFDDLQSTRDYGGFAVYSRSKLMNILFTRELARRLAGTRVTANCLHPGFVNTRFGDTGGGLMALGLRAAKKFALSPEEGARTLIYLASSPDVEGTSGEYFHQCRPATPSEAAQDDADAARLWRISAELSGVGA